MNQHHSEMRRTAVELLLSSKVNLHKRQNVRRALVQARLIPVEADHWEKVREAWITCCIAAAKAERLTRLLRERLH
jgi:hypothetical protein